jgi:hypothetical protein
MNPKRALATLIAIAFMATLTPSARAETTIGQVVAAPILCTNDGNSCIGANSASCLNAVQQLTTGVMDAQDCGAKNCGPFWRTWTADVDWTETAATDAISVQILCGGVQKASSGTCTSQIFDGRPQVCTAKYSAGNGDGFISCGITTIRGSPIVNSCKLTEPPQPVPLAEAIVEAVTGYGVQADSQSQSSVAVPFDLLGGSAGTRLITEAPGFESCNELFSAGCS